MPLRYAIITTDNPVALQEGREWQIEVDGERWYGPDTLAACIEAVSSIKSALDEYWVSGQLPR